MNKLSRVIRVVAFAAIFVFMATTLNATTWRVGTTHVKWRTGVNTSADTGYVITGGSDSTTILTFLKSGKSPDGMGNMTHQYLPDSTFVTFKALDVASGSGGQDSASFAVEIQTLGQFNKSAQGNTDAAWSAVRTVATILELNADSTTIGFSWGPKFWCDNGTPLGVWYRYVVNGGSAPTALDSTKIVDWVERHFVIDQ